MLKVTHALISLVEVETDTYTFQKYQPSARWTKLSKLTGVAYGADDCEMELLNEIVKFHEKLGSSGS